MGKSKLVLILMFALAVGSGMVGGVYLSRRPNVGVAEASGRTPLATELGLTAQQNEQMRVIWEEVRNEVDTCFTRARDVQKRRDDTFVALLTPDQKAKYARAQQECAEALADLKIKRDAAFAEAVKRTEGLLDEMQRKRYREILANRLGREAAGGPPDWIPPQQPATQSGPGR